MKHVTIRLALVFLVLPLLQACGGGARAWEGTVTASAGVAVVHNPATPLWGDGDEWTATEDLRIGTVAGEPEYQFGQLAFMDVGADGTIYAMDVQAQEVRVYDAQGRFVRSVGGPGGGPGEIGQGAIFVFSHPGGGLVVPDMGNQRVNRYGPQGEPLGSFPIQLQAGVPTRWELDRDGRLMAQLRGMNVPGMAALEGGDPIVVYDTTGAVVDTLAVIPKGQTLEGLTEQTLSIKIFAPEPVWALADDGDVFYAMNDQFRVLVNDPEGHLVRIITKDMEKKPVEESDRNAILRLLREQYQQYGVPAAQVEQIMAGIGFAEFFPAFGQLFVGPEETLWIQRIRSARDMADAAGEVVEFDPQDLGSPDWDVFDSQGRWLGVVTLPERFQPVNLTGESLYGIWRDELDVQYVMRVKVNRPA